MNPQLYLGLSVLMGLAQVVDARRLLKHPGKYTAFALVFSVVELAWLLPSYWVLQQANTDLPRWLPVSFIAYELAFLAGGVVLAIQQRGQQAPPPKSLLWAACVFGAYFALASAWQLLA